MRRISTAVLLVLLSAPAATFAPEPLSRSTAHAQLPSYGQYPRTRGWDYPPRVRVWVDDERDYFRHGDRLRVHFSTSADAYVAVVHIDPDGQLDFLFPRTPWDEEYLRAGRVYALPDAGLNRGWLVRGGSGIGYIYVLASPVPLDFRSFRATGGYGWDWSYGGRGVRGDPFWALEQITRLLIPDWGYVPLAVDYHSYYVGGRHRYPAYACSGWSAHDRTWGWGWGGGYVPGFGSCDRMDRFLRDQPYYFDARRYRGDRRGYFREYRLPDPRQGYRLPPNQRWSRPDPDDRRREGTWERERPVPPRTARPRDTDTRDDEADRPLPPERRPTLERRGSGREPAQGVTPSRRPSGATGSRPAPRGRESGGSGERPVPPGRRRSGGG